ncbi:MAG: hypothetical protein M1511_18745 [Deltaproteobacteria bacterium]|nr:hypothetical protein [Deltaproteobacteria bacterium]
MKMMKVLVFSKDRAMQVQATLQSFLAHCADTENIRINVLYTCSNEQHSRQYLQLAQEWQSHPQVRFIEQNRFRRDVFNILNPYSSTSFQNSIYAFLAHVHPRIVRVCRCLVSPPRTPSLIMFLVDDAIFTHEFRLSEIIECLAMRRDALGFSLRLGENTTYSYMSDREQQLPVFEPVDSNVQKYMWTKADQDFGYPLEVSSSIYRLVDVIPILLEIKFDNPNLLEGGMNKRRNRFASTRPFLLCYNRSVAFCNPVNLVQTVSLQNRAGTKRHYSPTELANLFDAGNRINFEAYHHTTPVSCHQEMELVFKKRDNTS